MKIKKEDKILKELFRHKLENIEIIPGPSVRTSLMKKVRHREFIRFNPSRFNIYYLAAAVAVSGFTLVCLISRPHKNENKLFHEVPSKKEISTVTDNVTDFKLQINDNRIIKSNQTDKPLAALNEKGSLSKNQDDGIQVIKTDVGQNKNPIKFTDTMPVRKAGNLSGNNSAENALRGIYNSKELVIEPSSASGCSPLKVHFRINSSSYDSCSWTFGEGGLSDKREPDWIFDQAGSYRVVANLFLSKRAIKSASCLITVYPKPSAGFKLSPENPVIPGDEINFINYSMDAVKYSWKLGDRTMSELYEPRHRYNKFDNYDIGLIVSSEFGCSDSLTVHNAFAGSGYFISFPNAFIPNPGGPAGGYYSSKSDETAQIFHPEFWGVSEYLIRIFSRRGIIVFESNDVNVGWDGYYNGQLCAPGVYVWKVRGKYINGEPYIKMGDVTLLKTDKN